MRSVADLGPRLVGALTEEHWEARHALCREVLVLVRDDRAGRPALLRAQPVALRVGEAGADLEGVAAPRHLAPEGTERAAVSWPWSWSSP